MKADAKCFGCCEDKAVGLLKQYQIPEQTEKLVMEQIHQKIKEADREISAPVLMADVMVLLEQYMDIAKAYEEPKRKYNELLLGREAAIWEEIQQEADSFLAALQYAVTGNYIDFGAMEDVKEEKLNELLEKRDEIQLDSEELKRLKAELERAKTLVYILDNAGEIVLDKIFIKVLKEHYPNLQIHAIVRGLPALNDVIMEDAKMTGLSDLVSVISNETNIPGTPIDRIGASAREAIEKADLCIAKGQGNFETMCGCNLNIYYLFLCKCELFVKKFQVERFSPVLKNETRIVQYA